MLTRFKNVNNVEGNPMSEGAVESPRLRVASFTGAEAERIQKVLVNHLNPGYHTQVIMCPIERKSYP
jgi:hypothetical protein